MLERETKEGLVNATMLISAPGQDITGEMSVENTQTETITILSATQIRVMHKPTTVVAKIIVNGKEENAPSDKPGPLDSLNVLLDKSDGKWTASIENGATPSEAQKKALEEQAAMYNANDELLLYGEAERMPGDKWDVDIATLRTFAGTMPGTGKGMIHLEFVEITNFNGVECALIKSTFEVAGKTPPEGSQPSMDATLKAENITYRSLSDFTDLQTTIKGDIMIKGPAGENVELTINGKNLSETKVTIKHP